MVRITPYTTIFLFFFEPFPFLLQEYVWWHHATTCCPCTKILTSVILRFFTKTYFFSSVWRWPMHFTKVFYSRFLNVVPCRKRPLHQVLMDSCSPQCMDSWKQMNAENCGFENLGFCFKNGLHWGRALSLVLSYRLLIRRCLRNVGDDFVLSENYVVLVFLGILFWSEPGIS